jgi:type VI secretion system protein ImpK
MSHVAPSSSGRLALILQESLTAVVRLRANRQPVSDAAAFRAQMTQLLARAEQDARASGYGEQDARLAVFAVVAFLDESVLNTRQPSLAEWARKPLQDELYGGHMGGEWFFQHVDQLLTRADDSHLADILEVHQLCLLLGFKGRYGAGDQSPLHAITTRVGERINRLRGAPGDLAPAWRPPNDAIAERDPWLRRLTVGAIAGAVLAVALWGAYSVMLSNTRADVRALVVADGPGAKS